MFTNDSANALVRGSREKQKQRKPFAVGTCVCDAVTNCPSRFAERAHHAARPSLTHFRIGSRRQRKTQKTILPILQYLLSPCEVFNVFLWQGPRHVMPWRGERQGTKQRFRAMRLSTPRGLRSRLGLGQRVLLVLVMRNNALVRGAVVKKLAGNCWRKRFYSYLCPDIVCVRVFMINVCAQVLTPKRTIN